MATIELEAKCKHFNITRLHKHKHKHKIIETITLHSCQERWISIHSHDYQKL